MTNNSLQSILLNLKYMANAELDAEDIQHDVKLFLGNVTLPNLLYPNSSMVVKAELTRLRDTSRLLLNSIITAVEETLDNVDTSKKTIAHLNNFREKYPFYVKANAPKKAIIFFDNLDKEEYSYSETAILLGISRQSVSTYVNNSLNGFKPTGKKGKVSKEHIYNYYANKLMDTKNKG